MDIAEWDALRPCQRLEQSDYLSEREAIFEAKRTLEAYGGAISETMTRQALMEATKKAGKLKVIFIRRGEGDDQYRLLPPDSAEIVFEISQYDGTVVPAQPKYYRKYWSEDICLNRWM
jgi:hypothetical protein